MEDGLKTRAYAPAIPGVMVPGLDGRQVLAGSRRSGRALPLLLLTARDQVGDRVKGPELGAGDPLVKPFAFAESRARVRALLRRGLRNQGPQHLPCSG